MSEARREADRARYIRIVMIVVLVLCGWTLVAYVESRPGPHYAVGFPPGTICTRYGSAAAEVCERDHNFKPTRKFDRSAAN